MTVTVELRPDVEARLAARAHSRGIPLGAYLQGLIEDLAGADPGRPGELLDLEATLDALAAMGNHLPALPASALTRDEIYRDHD